MEVGLWDVRKDANSEEYIKVLILVLMEVGLWEEYVNPFSDSDDTS